MRHLLWQGPATVCSDHKTWPCDSDADANGCSTSSDFLRQIFVTWLCGVEVLDSGVRQCLPATHHAACVRRCTARAGLSKARSYYRPEEHDHRCLCLCARDSPPGTSLNRAHGPCTNTYSGTFRSSRWCSTPSSFWYVFPSNIRRLDSMNSRTRSSAF